MATNTALTYRLQGIPRAYDRHETQDLACRLLSVDTSKVSVRSLALHPLKCDSKIATLSLLETPATIAPKQKTGVWSFREPDPIVAGKFIDFTLDTHFHGFTPLHDGEDEQCNIDLIALSGLNGHAFGSFKAKGLDFMWIRDALAAEFPGCRLFIYGYDTTMVHSTSHQSILDLGSQLASSVEGLISATPTGSESGRSLIFLGHSLGGLVVEQALIELCSRGAIRSRYEPILQKITGVLLFGVPKKGMSVEALITMVNEQPNRDLIASLSVDSAFLQLQQSNFQKARLEMSNASVVAFFETQETPTVQKNALGKWEMSGPSKLLVSKTSATSMSDTSIAVNRNHSEIVKFQPNDADYDRVLSTLRLMRRGNEQSHIEANPLTDQEINVLQLLGFPEQHWRRDEINPGEDTCEWLSENQTFQEWFRNPVNPELRRLWIRGHPGSGKSTLMKYTWEFLTRRLPATVTLVSFFFHARGTSLQQTRMGLLRSILHQLAFHLPEARFCLMRRCAEKRTVTQEPQWSEDELQHLIRESLSTCARPVCVLVDALDEAGKQTAVDLVKWFGRLTTLPNVRIVFSCRYYPVLPTISKSAISMETENATDIDRVVRAELRTEFDEDEAQVLENDIIKKAKGMFQWATLVTNSVVETYREMGQSIEFLRRMIHQLPPDLHALYDSLLSSVKAPEEKQTIKLFTWILFADRPLKQSELQHALVVDAEMEVRSVSEFSTSPLFVNLERAVKTLSRGLAQFETHDDVKIAQFIHQSVVDYLEADGLAKLLELQGKSAVLGHAQLQLSRSCIRYLLLKDLSEAVEAINDLYFLSVDDLHEKFPLAEYALHFWIIHTIHAELYGIDQQDLLDILPWARMDKVPRIFTVAWADTDYFPLGLSNKLPKPKAIGNLQKEFAWVDYRDLEDQKFNIRSMYELMWDLDEHYDSLEVPFNLFALAGISSVWRQLLAEIETNQRAITDKNLREMGSSLSKRRFYRTRNGRLSSLLAILLGTPDIHLEELPENLIKAQVNDAYHVTPLFLAVAMQREDLVRAFICTGAQGNVICDDGLEDGFEERELSIFELAILINNVDIMRQLIDAYGKGPGPTPNDASTLHFAIRHGSDAVFDMLVDQCSSRYTADEFINFSKDKYSQTPLQTALHWEEMRRCRKLIDAGADIENSADGSPLLLWFIDEEVADDKMLELLLECGADPNRGPPKWPTPFMSAMSYMWIDAIKVLLKDSRTDPNLVDEEGLTGLMQMLRASHDHSWRLDYWRCRSDNSRREAINITQLCALSGRFDMEIKDLKGETVLAKAVTTMRPEIVDVLLTDGKADPNTRSVCGWTPLMRAAFLGYWTITKLLLSCSNIDIEAQNSWGKTALYYAIVKGKITCANLILSHEKTDLPSLKAPLSSACFEAVEKGADFLAQLSDLQPLWFGHYLMSEIYNRAQQGNRRCIIRQLEETGFRPEEDVVMKDAS